MPTEKETPNEIRERLKHTHGEYAATIEQTYQLARIADCLEGNKILHDLRQEKDRLVMERIADALESIQNVGIRTYEQEHN